MAAAAAAYVAAQSADPCAPIPDSAIVTSFAVLPAQIRDDMGDFPNFAPTDAPCKLDSAVVDPILALLEPPVCTANGSLSRLMPICRLIAGVPLYTKSLKTR